MKRTPELRTLSEDHHGLVHARRLRRVAEGDEPYPAEARLETSWISGRTPQPTTHQKTSPRTPRSTLIPPGRQPATR
jgi:hypothetical protein